MMKAKGNGFMYMIPLLALFLLFPTAQAGEGSAREVITANVAHAIELTAPALYEWNDLIIGRNVSEPQVILIKSNTPFDLKLRSIIRTRMAEYDIAADEYVSGGASLEEALQWSFPDGEPEKISRSDVTILFGEPATSSSGKEVKIIFIQDVGYKDVRLPEGRIYRIEVAYTAVQSI